MVRFEIAVALMALMGAVCAQEPAPQPAVDGAKIAHAPVVLVSPPPEYPPAASSGMLGGRCVVSLLVDTSGAPQDVKLVRCSRDIFGSSSVAAVEKYRFQPAQDETGKPVAVRVNVEINFGRTDVANGPMDNPSLGTFRYEIDALPAGYSAMQPAQGVVPLIDKMQLPKLTRFPEKAFTAAASGLKREVRCVAVLTIDKKGVASDPSDVHCTEPAMMGPAADGLLASKYSPARRRGRAISVRALVRLTYFGAAPNE